MFLLHQRTQSSFIHGCSFIFNHVHELLPFSAWSHRAGAKTLLPFQSTSTELCSSATRVSSSSLSPASVCDETAVASLLTVLVNTETLMGCSEGTNKSLESFFQCVRSSPRWTLHSLHISVWAQREDLKNSAVVTQHVAKISSVRADGGTYGAGLHNGYLLQRNSCEGARQHSRDW